MNSVFSEQILADKLSKLNSTQQCIETLSHWCIFHRNKAQLVVATWDKQFHSPHTTHKIPFLYLANDILQNSKRKGNEFVTEFWNVLPKAVKHVFNHGDDHGKTVVSRLVAIWEQRKVFGSRAQGLKHLMLANESLPPLDFNNKKRSRSVRILKRDSRSVRIKLASGGVTDKIVSAFHSVLSEHPTEDLIMDKCKSAIHRVRKMETDIDVACTKLGDPKRTILATQLEEEETLLKQCIDKLKSVETTREALVSQLREALHEQESELENVRTQLQVAQAQSEEACNMRKRLNNDADVSVSDAANGKAGETPKKTAADIAAEVADKLAASTSSQQIMTSVLSTFAAQEAKNAGLATTSASSNSFPAVPTNSYSDTRSKLDKPVPVSDSKVFIASQNINVPASNAYQTVLVHQQPIQVQASISQPQYQLLSNPPSQQYLHPPGGGGVITGMSYAYTNVPPPPPPPPPGPPPAPLHMNMAVSLTQQQVQMIQQPPAPPSFRPLQPPGMVYYNQPR